MILPVVERELRAAARRATTYRMRFFAGLAAMVVWLVLLMGSRVALPAQLGHHLFNALGVLALGFSMLAGVFLTSDCVSEEKREGTLGLLFLTDLKGYDIVLGKLAAASVHAFFGLVAVFPMLALPLLMGGVSGAEFARVILVLSATLFLSLALGMFVSSISVEARHSTSGAFLLVILFAGICPALWWLQSIVFKARLFDPLLLPSPGYAYLKALDLFYLPRSGAGEFWRSLCTIGALGLGCVAVANFILPRVWQQGGSFRVRAARGSVADMVRGRGGGRERGRGFGRALVSLQENPYSWLVGRDVSSRRIASGLLRVLTPIWLTFVVVSIVAAKHVEAFITCIFLAYGMHLVLKVQIALEASRRASEDRHSGALELLLVTPLPVRTILAGHREALARIFKRPIRILVLVNLTMMAMVLWFPKRLDIGGRDDQLMFCELFLGGILMLLLDSRALCWVGMWRGLKAKRHHRAVVATLGTVMGLPWALVFLQVFVEWGFHSTAQVAMVFALWFGVGAVLDLVLGARTRRRLEREFRGAAAISNDQ